MDPTSASLPHLGEAAAVFTSVCWTIAVLAVEMAGRRVGSLIVNFLRLSLGVLILTAFSGLVFGHAWPDELTGEQWAWLLASGAVGFVIGDLCLVRAFVLIGGRLSMLVYASVPILTSLFDYLSFGTLLGPRTLLGMGLTILGVLSVTLEKKTESAENASPHRRRYLEGLFLAFLGSVAQSAGLILSKIGMGASSPFAATQIRVLAGIAGFALLITALRRWPQVLGALRDAKACKGIVFGAVFGPFLGVSSSLMALQHAEAGVAATLMGLTPILIIAPSAWLFKDKPSLWAIAGALLACLGTGIMVWP